MAAESHVANCLDDPNFATICSFIEKFGEICHVGDITFQELQDMVENTNEVPLPLVELHVRLLRRVYKSINTSKWEKSLCKFAHSFSSQDGWEIERCGYKKTKIQTKLRVLKNLLESQFDYNTKFKGEVNKLQASDLRMLPLGRDIKGHAYWYQVDFDANLRVYREDIDEETWEIAATNREEMESLVTQLKNGEVGKLIPADGEDNNVEEDTNGCDGIDIDEDSCVEQKLHESTETNSLNGVLNGDVITHIKEEDRGDGAIPQSACHSSPESVPTVPIHPEKYAGEIKTADSTISDEPMDAKESDTSAVKAEPSLSPLKSVEELVVADGAAAAVTDLSLQDRKEQLSAENEALQEPKKDKCAVEELTDASIRNQELSLTTDVSKTNVTFNEKIEQVEIDTSCGSSSDVISSVSVTHTELTTAKLPESIVIKEESADDPEPTIELESGAEKRTKNIPVAVENAVIVTEDVSESRHHRNDATQNIDAGATVAGELDPSPKVSNKGSYNISDSDSSVVTAATQDSYSEKSGAVETPDETSLNFSENSAVSSSSELRNKPCTASAIQDKSFLSPDANDVLCSNDVNLSTEVLCSVTAISESKTIDDSLVQLPTKEVEEPICENKKAYVCGSPKENSSGTINEEIENVAVQKLDTKHAEKASLDKQESNLNDLSITEDKISDPPSDVHNCGSLEAEGVHEFASDPACDGISEGEVKTEDANTSDELRPSATVRNDIPIKDVKTTEMAPDEISSNAICSSHAPKLVRIDEISQVPNIACNSIRDTEDTPALNKTIPQEKNGVSSEKRIMDVCMSDEYAKQPVESPSSVPDQSTIGCDQKVVTDSFQNESATQVEINSSIETLPTIIENPCGLVESTLTVDAAGLCKEEIGSSSKNAASLANETFLTSNTNKNVALEDLSVAPKIPIVKIEEQPSKFSVAEVQNEVTEEMDSSAISTTETTKAVPVAAKSLEVRSSNSDEVVRNSIDHSKQICVPLAKDSVPSNTIAETTSEISTNARLLSSHQTPSQPTVQLKTSLGLVGYADTSSEDEDDTEEQQAKNDESVAGSSHKRKLDAEGSSAIVEPKQKISKLSDDLINPIVGDTIEEDVMLIKGSGEGAQNEGGNGSPSDGHVSLSGDNTIGSGDDAGDTSQEAFSEDGGGYLPQKTKARGRPKKGAAKTSIPKPRGGRARKKSPDSTFSCRTNSFVDDTNGLTSSAPIRRSGRVAQIRQKEEEERRRLEEERLAQLKEAQLRKQKKQGEKDSTQRPKVKSGDKKGPKSKVIRVEKHAAYTPASDESASESQDDDDEDDYGKQLKTTKGRKRRKNKNGKPVKKGNPWLHSSSDDECVEDEEEHFEAEEEEEEELVFNGSDHEFSPESDMEENTESSPSRHARTAKQKEEAVDKYSETNCDKCGKGDHPEWILLCDECDKGWHASCVNPQLWVIPEGNWYCPPCQHNMLIQKLNDSMVEYEKLLKKRENDELRKQRIAYVGISISNMIQPEEKMKEEEAEPLAKPERGFKKQKRKRMLYSDDEVEGFINDETSSDSDSGSQSGSYESEEEPIYKLRARRATKAFNFQEYDDMIKSALRDSDADEAGEVLNGNKDTISRNAGETHEPEKEQQDEESQERRSGKHIDNETDEEELDEKEKNRRTILNQGARKTKRRLNDLSATSEEDSDEDFKGSGEDDDDEEEEENPVDEDSDWSGDGDSDDSIAVPSKRSRHQKLGRREKYLDEGMVRRSTRKRRSKVKYDESDQEEDDEEGEKWQSGESESEESESESDDETWGRKKKKKPTPGKSSVPNFFMNVGSITKNSKPKKKRRKVDEDEVDRAWSNKVGSKTRNAAEPIERKTRGRKINFKDILDSGESDDDGNIRPKRRRILSDSEEDERSDSPSSSRKLAEEIRAENQRLEAEAKEKLRLEEKAKEQKPAKKDYSVNKIKVHPTITESSVKIPSASYPTHETLEPVEEPLKSIKMTSIVESILRKSPGIPEITPKAAQVIQSSSAASHVSPSAVPSHEQSSPLPAVNLPKTAYLPTVLPSNPPVSGSGIGTGSARVGKKKTASMLTSSASSTDVLPFPSTKKSPNSALSPSKSPLSNPSTGVPPMVLPMGIPAAVHNDLQRMANPMYAANPALRAFHPAWVRNPPPYAGPPVPPSLGKPPPLSSASFVPQPSQIRPPSFAQPPQSIRVPTPSPLQAFQHFAKRGGEVNVAPYRLPPHHQIPRGTALPPIGRDRDRIFLGGNSPYTPYILPPHPQAQPPHAALFGAHLDYRPSEPYKEESADRATQSPSVSQSPPVSSAPAVSVTNDDTAPPVQGDGEFGGLVSYFSSQHSNDED